jgi:hypothetical protein
MISLNAKARTGATVSDCRASVNHAASDFCEVAPDPLNGTDVD